MFYLTDLWDGDSLCGDFITLTFPAAESDTITFDFISSDNLLSVASIPTSMWQPLEEVTSPSLYVDLFWSSKTTIFCFSSEVLGGGGPREAAAPLEGGKTMRTRSSSSLDFPKDKSSLTFRSMGLRSLVWWPKYQRNWEIFLAKRKTPSSKRSAVALLGP